MVIVQTHSLTKRYGDLIALDDCTLDVAAGEVFGLLGPNGAGKTTLIRLLLGFLRPTSGTAQIEGLDCYRQSVDVRRRLSYLPGEPRLFRRMRAHDVLRFFASLRRSTGDFERSLRVAGRLDLDTSRRVALMSTGMRQKLALVVTLSHDTRLLVLDEPTANLDPNVRREVMAILRELRDEGKTLLLSSHVLTEIEEVCDRAVILRDGRLVHMQNIQDLRQRHRISGRCAVALIDVPNELANRVTLERRGEQVVIETEGDLADVLPWISRLNLSHVQIEPTGLKAVYENHHASEEAT